LEQLRLGGHVYDTLVGYSGFVGGTLDRRFAFGHRINSKNSETLAGLEAEGVVCAGVSAVKWKANAEPEADLAHVTSIFEALKGIRTKRFVLISTIDVYASPQHVDESTNLDDEAVHPYGKHRLMFEAWVRDHFEQVNIVRLPGLFGRGLKKNLIYDLLNDNQVENIHPEGQLQWFDMERFPHMLDLAVTRDLPMLNVVAEPVRSADIRDLIAPGVEIGAKAKAVPLYDVRTLFADLTEGQNGYHFGASETLANIGRFARQEQERS